jgi:hypothetical protein
MQSLAAVMLSCEKFVEEMATLQVGRKEMEGRFAEQLMLMLRANMDGLKKRAKVKTNAKASQH